MSVSIARFRIQNGRYVVGYNGPRGVLTVYWRRSERPDLEDKAHEAASYLESVQNSRRLRYDFRIPLP